MDYDNTLLAQRVFYKVMNAFAHPLRAYNISEEAAGNPNLQGDDSVMKSLCTMLLDNTVSFCVHGDDRLSADIQELTYARPVRVEDADFVFLREVDGFNQWDKVHQGTLFSPHEAATVIIETKKLTGEAEVIAQGPGIKDSLTCCVDPDMAECLREKAALVMEYPKGFELLFVTRQGDLCAVPRHVIVQGEGF